MRANVHVEKGARSRLQWLLSWATSQLPIHAATGRRTADANTSTTRDEPASPSAIVQWTSLVSAEVIGKPINATIAISIDSFDLLQCQFSRARDARGCDAARTTHNTANKAASRETAASC